MKAVMHTWEHSWIWISGCVLCPELDWDAQHIFLILGNPLGALQTAEPNFRVLGGPGEANLSILLLIPGLFSRCTFLGCSELWQDFNQGRCLWGTAEQHLHLLSDLAWNVFLNNQKRLFLSQCWLHEPEAFWSEWRHGRLCPCKVMHNIYVTVWGVLWKFAV